MNRGQRRAQWRTQFRAQAPQARSSGARPATQSVAGFAHARRALARQKPGSVQVTIEELVLRGFERGSTHGIADGLQRQLTVLLSSRGVPEVWTRELSANEARAEAIRVGTGAKDLAIGERIAQSLFDVCVVNSR
jgi:hypothetical protein